MSKKRFSALLWLSMVALFTVCMLAVRPATAQNADASTDLPPWTTWLGAGAYFFEGGQEYYPGQLYELKVGYDVQPQWTVEGTFGGMPFFEAKEFSNRVGLYSDGIDTPGEGWGLLGQLDLLYHFNKDRRAKWDPYASVGGGLLWLNQDDLQDADEWQPYYGPGAGVSYNINESWAVRADYRFAFVDSEPNYNHQALALVGYRWGASRAGMAAESKGLFEQGQGQGPLKTVYFDFDSSALSPASQTTLRQNVQWLQANGDKKVELQGNCDERGTNEYNMALGERRARSALEYMRTLGIPAERMSTVSFGEENPVDPGHNEEAWAKNRRVDSVVK